jgi:hypothetical protein
MNVFIYHSSKKIILLTLVLLLPILIFAQKKGALISWDKTSYDFGIIKKENGLVKYKFTFINIGDEPLMIQKVKPSCGCTTSNYSKEPIPPASKGFVEIIYEPANQIGVFNKTIAIITNEKSLVASKLEIKGRVISK